MAAQAVAGEVDAVCIVDEAIEDGVRVGRIADQLMPSVDRNLAGDDGRASAVAFFEDFEKVVAGGGVERLEAPVVEDQELHAGEGAQQTGIATVAAGEREVGEEDLDTSVYRDDQIDLNEVLREQFYLALPMKPLCREDCAGLCPKCGTNRNTGTCSCATGFEDPRLAPLRGLKQVVDRRSPTGD